MSGRPAYLLLVDVAMRAWLLAFPGSTRSGDEFSLKLAVVCEDT